MEIKSFKQMSTHTDTKYISSILPQHLSYLRIHHSPKKKSNDLHFYYD